ncbi:MAG: hypothetical protein LBU70_06280 [Chitinispirillales bacterium]|jgi:cytoskeletal protein RodZ|nr:hypothetical protein [Chitinispirillales bacterium]
MVILRNIKKKDKKKAKKGKKAKRRPRPKKAKIWIRKLFALTRRALVLVLIMLVAGLAGFLIYRNREHLLSAATTVKTKVSSISLSVINWRPEKKTRQDTVSTADTTDSTVEMFDIPEIPKDTATIADTTDTAADTVAAVLADTAITATVVADTTVDAYMTVVADTVENVAADTTGGTHTPVSTDTVAAAPPPAATPDLPALPAVPAISGIFTLQDITCRLADRDDLRISMSVELFYDSEILRDELNFKRGALTTIVTDVVRRYEYGNIALPALRTDLLNAFNRILHDGQLPGIDIRNFRVIPAESPN